MDKEQFFDLYDFLGVPPASPPNLVYLAIHKMKQARWEDFDISAFPDFTRQFGHYLSLAEERLLSPMNSRKNYNQEWESYYFPNDGKQTDIEQFCLRIGKSNFLTVGLRHKRLPLLEPSQELKDSFQYGNDFLYFMMRDLPKERDVFFLNPQKEAKLLPFDDFVYFEKKQFHLHAYGVLKTSITNDAMGKSIVFEGKEASLPLHIGDRIEFANGIRLILKSTYSSPALMRTNNTSSENDQKLALFFSRENVPLVLNPQKIYIIGRNTTDIRDLKLDPDVFCFVNIGRRERSISRQNFQVFCHEGRWYIEDLGSRYGTTLDFVAHPRMETLTSGGIMALEKGQIRLGYEKAYIIQVDSPDNIKKNPFCPSPTLPKMKREHPCIYDIPIF